MPIKQTQNKISQLKLNRGFGLVELLVSISIMILVMGVILARNSAFNGASLLRAQAYDMALAIREMQLLAISATNDGGGGYRNVYGLVFDKSNPNRYIIFRDDNDNNQYDSSPSELFGKQGIIDQRYRIDEVNYLESSGETSKDRVTVLFRRPNFDAVLYEGSSAVSSSVYGVEIVIRRKGTTGDEIDKVRTIEISRAGQITVK